MQGSRSPAGLSGACQRYASPLRTLLVLDSGGRNGGAGGTAVLAGSGGKGCPRLFLRVLSPSAPPRVRAFPPPPVSEKAHRPRVPQPCPAGPSGTQRPSRPPARAQLKPRAAPPSRRLHREGGAGSRWSQRRGRETTRTTTSSGRFGSFDVNC